MSNVDLKGKVALITGGGGGIGSATALRLARSGAAIAVVDIFSESAEKIVEIIRGEGHVASAFQADLGDIEQIYKVVDDVAATFGRIDILHNNAVFNDQAIYQSDLKLLDVNVEHWDKIFAVNVRAPMLLSKLVIPHMLKQGAGVIVNMSSGASQVGQPDMLTAYGSSKGALNTLTLYTAAQYGRQKIRCNALVCAAVLTPNLKKLFTPEQLTSWDQNSSTGRAHTAEDIAAFIHFLVSDDAQQINGQLYTI